MNPEVLERVLSCERLPSLPAVALQVIELTQDRNVTVNKLADAIRNDQGLVSKILRTVNSSFYALRKPCSTIQQAIVLLGLSAVKSLALGFSLVQSVRDAACPDFDHTAYWRRGLYSGIAGKCIAGAARTGHDEECFLGGLLQDVGVLAMCQALGDEYLAVLRRAAGDHGQLIRHELAVFETQHPEIGALLAKRWKLPDELVMPIRYHERPTAAPSEYVGICQAVALGNIAADVLSAAEPAGPLKRFYTRADEWFRITPMQADDILRTIAQSVQPVARLLELNTGAAPKAEQILERAKDQLREMAMPIRPGADSGTPGEDEIDRDTGLLARGMFDRNLLVGYELVGSGAGTLGVALLRVDRLDELAGSAPEARRQILAGVAGVLQGAFDPAAAAVCRFDADRFAVVMPRCEAAAVLRQVESVRALVASKPVTVSRPGGREERCAVTLSAGVVVAEPGDASRYRNAESVLRIAEQALAAAAAAGTNTLRVFTRRSAA